MLLDRLVELMRRLLRVLLRLLGIGSDLPTDEIRTGHAQTLSGIRVESADARKRHAIDPSADRQPREPKQELKPRPTIEGGYIPVERQEPTPMPPPADSLKR